MQLQVILGFRVFSPLPYLVSSKQLYHKVSYKGNDKNTSNENEVEEDIEAFLLEEQRAQDEMERNPLHNPIVDLLPHMQNSQPDRKRSLNHKHSLKPSLTYQNKGVDFHLAEQNVEQACSSRKFHINSDTELVSMEDEPMPFPQKVPSFIHKNVPNKNSIKDYRLKSAVDLCNIKMLNSENKREGRMNTNKNLYTRSKERSPILIKIREDANHTHRVSNTFKDNQGTVLPNQKKGIIKEVSVHLNGFKSKKNIRKSSLPENIRDSNKATFGHAQPSSRKCKWSDSYISLDNNVKSRLYEPTTAYKRKKEATLNDRQKKMAKKQKEIQQMVAPNRFVTGNVDAFPQDFATDTRESSPNIEVKEYARYKNEAGGSVKRPSSDQFYARHNSRRKRKERHDKINYEKSPVNTNTNRYMVKHTYTKLEHDAAGPKFTVIK